MQRILNPSVASPAGRISTASVGLAVTPRRSAAGRPRRGRGAAAAVSFRSVLQAAGELAGLDPTNPTYQRSVMIAEGRLADLDADEGRVEQAAAGYRTAWRTAKQLRLLNPKNAHYRADLDWLTDHLNQLGV